MSTQRELLQARIALDRVKAQMDAIDKIVAVLADLPDADIRFGAIEYLYKQLKSPERAS